MGSEKRVEAETRDALRRVLAEIGHGGRILRRPRRDGPDLRLDGKRHECWTATVTGYGSCLQTANVRCDFELPVNRLPSRRPGTRPATAGQARDHRERRVARIAECISACGDLMVMRERHERALRLGLTRPIRAQDDEADGRHLLVDVDALGAYVRLEGLDRTREVVRRALARTFGRNRDSREIDGLRAVNMRLTITLTPDGEWPEYWNDDGQPLDPDLWMGDVLMINATLPDAVATASAGRALKDVVSGTLIGERLIASMDKRECAFSGTSTVITVNRSEIPLREALPTG